MTIEGDVYHQLFDVNPRPMFVSDSETMQLLAVNGAACALYGWSREELLAMTLRDIRPPEERAWFEASFADTEKERSGTYSRFGRHRAKDGRVFEVILEITHVTFAGRLASLAVITDVTGIGEVERRFKLLVEHSADGISLTNANHHVEYISPGGRRILGYDDDNELANPTMFVHPDDRARWTAPALGKTQHFISRVRHRDGSWRWIESATTNLTNDSAVRAYVTNFRDITERVESQRRLEFLLSATPAVTYTTRIDTRRATYMGANVREVLGHDPEPFCAQDGFWRANIHPEDWPAVETALARITEEDAHTLCYRFKHADGTYRWMRDAWRVVRDASGKVEIVGFWVDITDQVSAQDTVKRSEKKFRNLIERAPIATFVHAKGRFVYVNAAGVSMLGHGSADEIIGRPIIDYVHPHDRDLLQVGPFRDIRIVRADGSIFVLEGTAMLSDFDGMPSHVVMGHDVTERDALFARIAMADRMLSVGTLAAGVAHEINNPLAYIAANLELLAGELPHIRPSARSRLTDATLQCLVTDAREGVARVNAIVRDLRSLSRPVDHHPVPVDVVDVLASSIKMTQNEIRHRARVVQTYEDGLPRVEADPSRLGQVFINLLLNAAQAIVEG
jgi:PAS domain S-box-containing protein